MTTTTKAKQNMIAVSTTAKQFVQDCTADFGGPSKSKDFLAASEREIVDGLVEFVTRNRYAVASRPVMIEETSEEGETRLVPCPTGAVESYEVDTFEGVMGELIAARMDTVRTNSTASALKGAQDELAKLRAELAALKGE